MAGRQIKTAGIDIISVTYNSSDDVACFYKSLLKNDIEFDAYFVDNNSSDGTVGILRELGRADPRLHVIVNDHNVGLAAANNQPIRHLHHEFVAIINPDIILSSQTLVELVEYLEKHPDVVCVGPVNIDERGRPHSSFHHSWTLAHLVAWRIFPMSITAALYKPFRRYVEQDVLFVSGACLVTRRKAFQQIGGYDAEYFLTVEDACDLCIRLSQTTEGVVRVIPSARVTHLCHRSVASAPFIATWQGARGSVYHFRKHQGLMAAMAATAILLLNSAARALVNLLLAPFESRFADNSRSQARVFWKLLTENPISNFRTPVPRQVEAER